MTKNNSRIAFVLALTVVFAVLFSAFFIIAEADHDCAGDDCAICCQINACENILKSVGQAVAAVVSAAFLSVLIPALPKETKAPAYPLSLITLKVKLSD